MLDELKDARALLDSAIRHYEDEDTTQAIKNVERTSVLLEQALQASGTRFSSIVEDSPDLTATTITRQDIIDGGVPK